jgi:hypothetical protein
MVLPFHKYQILKINNEKYFYVLEKSLVPFVQELKHFDLREFNTNPSYFLKKTVVPIYEFYIANIELVLPSKQMVKRMNIEELNEDQINQMHEKVSVLIKESESNGQVSELDMQLAIWDVMEDFNIPPHQIGALIQVHGEQIIGEALAKQLIGIL